MNVYLYTAHITLCLIAVYNAIKRDRRSACEGASGCRETKRKINSSGAFALSLLFSFRFVNEQLCFDEKYIYGSIDLTCWRSTQSLRLQFSKALKTNPWKEFWSKGSSSHFENYPSLLRSWTWSDVFRINENPLSDMFTWRDGRDGAASLVTKL